jgi:hypothetical protein
MIRLIIAGSRSIDDVDFIYKQLNKLVLPSKHLIECVIDGMAPEGVDHIAYMWCIENGIRVDEYPADWNNLEVPICKIKERNGKKFNCLAGFNRNQVMSEKGTHCILFNDVRQKKTGTNGTNDMKTRAIKSNIKVHEILYKGK